MFEGLVIASVEGFVNSYELEKRFNNENLRYLQGFVTHFTNGYLMVNGGGGASGHDFVEVWLLDEKGNIIYNNEQLY